MFSKYFPENKNKVNYLVLFTALLPLIIIIPFTFTSKYINNASIESWGINLKYGTVYYVFLIYFLLYMITGIGILIKKLFTLKNKYRNQLVYLLIGITVTFIISIIVDSILPLLNINYFTPIGPISTIVFVGFTAYAITKHQLMDISVIIKKSTYFLGVFLLIAAPLVLVANFITSLLPQSIGHFALVISAVIWSIVILLSDRLKNWLKEKTDKIFFMGDYDSKEVLSVMTGKMQNMIDITTMVKEFDEYICDKMKITNTGIFIYNKKNTRFYYVCGENIKFMRNGEINRHNLRQFMPIKQNNSTNNIFFITYYIIILFIRFNSVNRVFIFFYKDFISYFLYYFKVCFCLSFFKVYLRTFLIKSICFIIHLFISLIII
jgi:hypothetical protein